MNPPDVSARDLAARILLQEDRRGTWIREQLAPARGALGDARDQALLTELTYGVVRRRGTLDRILDVVGRRPVHRLGSEVRTALRLGLYQVLFLDRVPAHAAVDHAVGWVRDNGSKRATGYANGVLRACVRQVAGPAPEGPEVPRRDVPRADGAAVRTKRPVFSDPATQPARNLGERYSMPEWIVKRWLDHVGADATLDALRASISRPPLVLRAREDSPSLLAWLEERGARATPVDPPGAIVVEEGEPTAIEAVEAGRAWVQDATAQRVVPLMGLHAGERVLDLCAAPGGKALQIADAMGRGTLVASDVEPGRVRTLEALAEQIPSEVDYTAVRVHRRRPLPFDDGAFDAVLIDAPCSNTGVLRRRVEARWRLKPSDIQDLAGVQLDLLERAVPVTAPAGRIVYATCSYEPEENAGVLEAFLERHTDWAADEPLRVPPGLDGDGAFAVVLRRR